MPFPTPFLSPNHLCNPFGGRNERDSRGSVAARTSDLYRRFRRHRESHDEQRAAFRLVLAGNLAPVLLDDSIHSAKAQTRALADGLGGIERIENPLRLANPGT